MDRYTAFVTETLTWKPGDTAVLTMPHPHFDNVAPTVETVTVLSTTVHGSVWVATTTQNLRVRPERLTR